MSTSRAASPLVAAATAAHVGSLTAAAANLSLFSSTGAAATPQASLFGEHTAGLYAAGVPGAFGTHAVDPDTGMDEPTVAEPPVLEDYARVRREATMRGARSAAAEGARDAWSAGISRVTTFSELVAMVHPSYRDVLRPLFSEVFARQEKLESSRDDLERLRGWSLEKLSREWPDCVPKPQLPPLQLKKESTGHTTELRERMLKAQRVYALEVVRTIAAAREQEISDLEPLLDADRLAPAIGSALISRFKVIIRDYHSGVDLQEWFDGISANAVSGEGLAAEQCVPEGVAETLQRFWSQKPGKKGALHGATLIFDQVNATALPTAIAVAQLVSIKYQRDREGRERKRAAKIASTNVGDMDVDMGLGAASTSASGSGGALPQAHRAAIGDLVAKRVARAMASKGRQFQQGVSDRSLTPLELWILTGINVPNYPGYGSPPSKRPATKTQGEAQDRRRENGQRQARQRWQVQGQTQTQRRQEQAEGSGTSRPQRRQEEEVEVNDFSIVSELLSDQTWTWTDSTSYPDRLLDIVDSDIAARVLFSRMPVLEKTLVAHRSMIHIGPDVKFDHNMALEFSAGLKYMFHNKSQRKLVSQAYSDWCRRIQWKLIFRKSVEAPGVDPLRIRYIPLFNCKPLSNKHTYFDDSSFQHGLDAGALFVEEFVNKFSVKSDIAQREAISQKRVASYLRNNNLLLLTTDKNLGCALVTRDWYIDNTQKFLDLTPQFVPRSSFEWTDACIDTISDISLFVETYSNVLNQINEMIPEFILSKLPAEDAIHQMKAPTFKGLPKIHKKPWAFRPIIPCHSVPQAPLGIFLDWFLKPVLNSLPTVLNGSKELAIKLRDLNVKLNSLQIHSSRRLYVITGDITAFYTNVPRELVEKEVLKKWSEFVMTVDNELYESVSGTDIRGLWEPMLTDALRIAGGNLYYEFNNTYGEQTDGLAMGVPHSPLLANIFGFQCEIDEVNRLKAEGVLHFFGRYIDDAICIIEASNAQEALMQARRIKYTPCHIGWEVAERSAPFLDSEITVVKRSDMTWNVHWQIYRKALNHFERIPWASAHPYVVKRGTFYGELSRLATLSSEYSMYLYAIEEAMLIYRRRGYPESILLKWLEAKKLLAWNNRFSEREQKVDPDKSWFLKSIFNEAWEEFPLKELETTVKSHFQNSSSDLVNTWLMQGSFIVSRKSTFQVRDFVNKINRRTLSLGPEDIEGEFPQF